MDVFIVLWSCLFTTKLSCLQKKTLVTLRVKQGSKDLNSCTWHSLSLRKKNDTEHWTQSDPVVQTNDVYKWKKMSLCTYFYFWWILFLNFGFKNSSFIHCTLSFLLHNGTYKVKKSQKRPFPSIQSQDSSNLNKNCKLLSHRRMVCPVC